MKPWAERQDEIQVTNDQATHAVAIVLGLASLGAGEVRVCGDALKEINELFIEIKAAQKDPK